MLHMGETWPCSKMTLRLGACSPAGRGALGTGKSLGARLGATSWVSPCASLGYCWGWGEGFLLPRWPPGLPSLSP